MKWFTVTENDYGDDARRVEFPALLKETASRLTAGDASRLDRVNVSYDDGLLSIENKMDGTADAGGEVMDADALRGFLEKLPGVAMLDMLRWKNPDLPPSYHARAYEE